MKKEKLGERIEELISTAERNVANTYCFLFMESVVDPKEVKKRYYNDTITPKEIKNLVKDTEKNLNNELWFLSFIKENKEKIISKYGK